MILLSCINCSFNGLQYDTVGTAVGYCVEHRRILNTPGELTCGRLFRKDLPLASAQREQGLHEERFSPRVICSLTTRTAVNGSHTSGVRADVERLKTDPIAAVVTDYGLLDSKIESLAQLAMLRSARSEIALASLGRTYLRRCVSRGGQWTSGLHMFWWIKGRLGDEPDVRIEDLRTTTTLPLARQVDLARWTIVMLRLTFLSDVGAYAQEPTDRIWKVRDLPERAAEATGSLSLSRLMRWVRTEGRRILDEALPEEEYARRSVELHRTDPPPEPQP